MLIFSSRQPPLDSEFHNIILMDREQLTSRSTEMLFDSVQSTIHQQWRHITPSIHPEVDTDNDYAGNSLPATSKLTLFIWSIVSWVYCVITLWRYQMETFSASPVDYPHSDQWRGALLFSLICAGPNNWANNRYACDLRRHGVNNDVTVMLLIRINVMSLSFNIGNIHMSFWPVMKDIYLNELQKKHCLKGT